MGMTKWIPLEGNRVNDQQIYLFYPDYELYRSYEALLDWVCNFDANVSPQPLLG